ncbi:MAG TPA: hypothetical protein VG457_00375 [Planctomycetota bacterium]|nr:hypothetical protein [Planctomycetota bacterium]
MSEAPGTLIGQSNVMTRLHARVSPGPDPDSSAALLERVRTHSTRGIEGRESFIHDAVVLGKRVRLFSNSHHLADFWRDNWWTEAEWRATTGQSVSREPALVVHAMINIPDEAEASYVSLGRQEVFLFNTSYYGDLRATAMESLGRLIGKAGFVLHAAAVEINGRGLALVYPKDVIHPTPTWGLMEIQGSSFVADGWIALEPSGRVHALEKSLYVRTSVLASYPEYASRLLLSKFENVPDVTPDQFDARAAQAEALDAAARRNDPRQALRGLPPERSQRHLLRLIASSDARAMVSAETLFGKKRILRMTTAAAAFALRAGGDEPVHPAAVEPFPCPGYEIAVGAVPGHPRELAKVIAAT